VDAPNDYETCPNPAEDDLDYSVALERSLAAYITRPAQCRAVWLWQDYRRAQA
jgi:hypothetical protein